MVSRGDIIAVFDMRRGQRPRYLDAEVVDVGDVEVVEPVGSDEEPGCRRRYISVICPDGRYGTSDGHWVAIAEWSAGQAESDAFIYRAPASVEGTWHNPRPGELSGADLLLRELRACVPHGHHANLVGQVELHEKWMSGDPAQLTTYPALIAGNRALALDIRERDPQGHLWYVWGEWRFDGKWHGGGGGDENAARAAVRRWLLVGAAMTPGDERTISR